MPAPFKVITKAWLKNTGFGAQDAEELCGPASVAMLLQAGGSDMTVQEIVGTMKQQQAFIPGIGTVLARVPHCFRTALTYVPYVPVWLLVMILGRGYGCAHSIKQGADDSGHIVFVYAAKGGLIRFYDPNRDDDAPAAVPVGEWRKMSNHRAVFMKLSRLDLRI